MSIEKPTSGPPSSDDIAKQAAQRRVWLRPIGQQGSFLLVGQIRLYILSLKMKFNESSPHVKKAIKGIERAIAEERTISLVTWILTDYGEFLLHRIAAGILQRYGRSDLLEIVYPAVKELVINATKANMKRVFFARHGIDPMNPAEYDRGMKLFKDNLTETMIMHHLKDFKDRNFKVTITFYYTDKVMNIKVKNNFPLLPREEERIREKFARAQSFTSLFDFYMTHGDETEGAGLGLTMVGILLDQSGIDRHAFTVFQKPGYSETAARLEIPLHPEYIPRRRQFELELQRSGKTIEDLRRSFRPSMR